MRESSRPERPGSDRPEGDLRRWAYEPGPLACLLCAAYFPRVAQLRAGPNDVPRGSDSRHSVEPGSLLLLERGGELFPPSLSLVTMRRILVTGMSGTGKSSALAELGRLGFRVVDTDVGGWSEWSDAEGGYVWREDGMRRLLACEEEPSLYVSGTVSDQGRFYGRFDAVVLLSAPAEVLLSRIENRTTNTYGKSAEQRELVLCHLAEDEPLLRRTCTHELDAGEPLARIVEQLAELAREPHA